MKLLTHAIALLLPAVVAAEAGAQTLAKEIVVEKEIVPEEREASRITMLPQLQLPAVAEKQLSWTDRPVAAPVTTSIEVLSPSGYLSAMPRPDTRGYFTLGYFPMLEAGATAGYRFIDSEATTLGITAAYEGSSYKADDLTGLRRDYRDHTASGRLYLRHEAGTTGTITADISGLFSSYNRPLPASATDPSVKAADFNAGLGWQSSVGTADYYVSGRFNHFAFNESGVAESMGHFDLGFNLPFNEKVSVGADADINFMSDKVGDPSRYTFSALNPLDRNSASGSLTPYASLKTRSFTGRVGVYLSAVSGRSSGSMYVCPVLSLGWQPVRKFTLDFALRAEYRPHSVAGEWMSCHYIDPGQFYGYSKIADYTLRAIIGPFSGASLSLWGSLGKNDGALMPLITTDNVYLPMMGAFDMNTGSFGGSFDYRYGNLGAISISYEIAPNDWDSGLADRTDRARGVLKASLTVTPIDRLDLTLGFESRSGRRIYCLVTDAELPTLFGNTFSAHDLGKVENLHFGFTFRINSTVTVWGRAENLLNRHWMSPWLRPCKGVTGLVGAAFAF